MNKIHHCAVGRSAQYLLRQSPFKAIIPTQDKNRPKADFCPSGFINFGQQKTCAPIRIFCFCFQTSHRGWSTAKNVCKIL